MYLQNPNLMRLLGKSVWCEDQSIIFQTIALSLIN